MVLRISIRIPCSFKKEEKISKDQEEQTHLAIAETAKDKLHLAKDNKIPPTGGVVARGTPGALQHQQPKPEAQEQP